MQQVESAPSASTSRVKSKPDCRLLWRGSLSVDSTRLHGIAFIAHIPLSADEPPSQRPNLLRTISSSSTHQVDDPFSPNAISSSNTDLFLDLEMLRHKELVVQRTVDLAATSNASASKGKRGLKNRIELLKKGKEKVEIDQNAAEEMDVRVYLDPRCLSTKRWFENRFCLDELDADNKSPRGLLISLGEAIDSNDSTDIIIYASLSSESALQLRLARRKVPVKARPPRPDDPLPRESLFTQKLRRSASTPVLSLGTASSTKPLARPMSRSSTTLFAKQPSKQPISARNPFAAQLKRGPPTPGKGRSAKRIKSSPKPELEELSVKVEDEDMDQLPDMSFIPPSPTGLRRSVSVQPADGSIKESNKAMIKKMVMAALTGRGVLKNDPPFKDLYGIVTRGVQFALRAEIEDQVSDRMKIGDLIERHLRMYMPSD